jgi:hypothetical protein
MTIPSTFPAHWRKAVEAGDASGFTDAEDAIAFFDATSNSGCFSSLSEAQRGNVADLRSVDALANLHLESIMRRHAREREAEQTQAALKGPRFFGNSAVARPAPTLAELQPEIEAIEAEVEKIGQQATSDAWAKVIAKHNQRVP